MRRLAFLIAVAFGFAAPAGAKEPPGAEITQLIEQLGSEQYVARQRAERELTRLGAEAFDALTAAENHLDLEIAARARYLARRIKVDWVREDDSPEVKRIMTDYESSNDEVRLERARQLLVLNEGQGIPALVRIIRFEKSPLLSKQAAMLWLDSTKLDEAYWRRHREAIEKHLGATSRPAGAWLRVQTGAFDNAQAALAAWDPLIEKELAALAANPADSDKTVVLSLMRRKIALQRKLGLTDQAIATMIAMIDFEDGSLDALTEHIEWLVDQKAWPVIDQLAQRFQSNFQNHWTLLYLLAQARAAQGDAEGAQKLAEKAFKLEPNETARHLRSALYLQQRGQYEWAEREYRYVMQVGPPVSRTAIYAAVWLPEMLHDEGKDLAGGEVLKTLVDSMAKAPAILQGLELIGRDPASVRSRMDYFFACHYAAKGDFAKQREHLDRAIRHDPSDADVLIAMYHLPNVDDKYRVHTLELIQKTAAQFDEMVDEFPEDSTGYNQYAWLIGNTEGDLDKAIRYSHRSLELKPATAGYLDTLAHCYYTQGDYASAVKYQTLAVELDPHTGLIQRPLEKFRKALEKAESEKPKAEKSGEK